MGKSIGIFKNIDISTTTLNGTEPKVIIEHMKPSGITNNDVSTNMINDDSYNCKLLDSIFIYWNGAQITN